MAIGPAPVPVIPDALDAINAGLAGQTLDQAWQSQNMSTPDDIGFGISNWTSNEPSISGNTSGTISDNLQPIPVDAWHDYVENEAGKVSIVTGGIVDGSSVDTFVYSLVEQHPSAGVSVVKAVAPVAIPIQQAVVAISQTLGLSMNVSEMTSEVKQKFVDAITNAGGLVYDSATGLVKAWWDGVNILFPKKAIEAVGDLMQEEGWGGDEGGTITSPILSGSYPYGLAGYAPNPGYQGVAGAGYLSTPGALIRINENSLFGVVASATRPVRYTVTTLSIRNSSITPDRETEYSRNGTEVTIDGRTCYYDSFSMNNSSAIIYTGGNALVSPDTLNKVAWSLLYGTITPSGVYPEGTAPSEAISYTSDTIPEYGDLAISEDETIPLVPVNLPENPDSTIDSTVDPISSTDEGEVEDLPAPPVPLPIPDTKPSNPNVPLVDPSIVDSTLVDELVEELANTLDPQAPQSSGVIPVPPLPGIYDPDTGQTTFPSIIPQSGPGFIHVYNPTPAEFVAFGTWLWVTYADATIDKILNNPFDGVIGAHELYATPNRDGSDNIRSAFLTCPTTAALVTNRYSEIDCGTVIVPEFYGNYLDYSPYSQAYIYLPFIGINEVSIDDIVGHAVNIRYRVDSYSGSCIAMIFVAKDGYQNLCYQFAGSCSVEVPMAGGSQAAIKAGMMQAEAYARAAMIQAGANAVGGIGSALMGNVGGVLSSLSGIASNYAQAQAGVEAAKVANKSSVQHSGQFGASHGAMGEKVPFFIIRNPIQVKVVNYNEDYGFPAHKRVIVGGCRGYLRVREVNVISAHATDEEKMAIEMALKGGVYVS